VETYYMETPDMKAQSGKIIAKMGGSKTGEGACLPFQSEEMKKERYGNG
jgi:hypothetical protein